MTDPNPHGSPPRWMKVLFIILGVLGGLALIVGICFVALFSQY